jgi:RNA polymerase sigma-70 factor, ECF subfamily
MPESFDTITPTLLQRVRSRDETAWSDLLRIFGPVVRAWARSAGVAPADHDDIVQETFLKVSKSLEGFRREKPGDTFLGWLRTLTRHRIAEYYARRGEVPVGGTDAREMPELLPDISDEDLIDDSTRITILREALRILKEEFEPKTWAAFERTALDGQLAADVAERFGMSVGAVYVAKSVIVR